MESIMVPLLDYTIAGMTENRRFTSCLWTCDRTSSNRWIIAFPFHPLSFFVQVFDALNGFFVKSAAK
jgi:hypothetical protein